MQVAHGRLPMGFLAFLGSAAQSGATGPDLARYLLVCAGLIALVGICGWLFKKLVAGHWRARAAARSLEIVDVLPLSRKQRVAVVRCYDRTFALGIGEREIALISELDPVVAPAPERAIQPAHAKAFGQLLERLRPAPAAAKAPAPAAVRMPARRGATGAEFIA